MITLPVEYFPYVSGALALIVVLMLIRGYARGFLFQIIDLATLALTLFLSWPIGQALAGLFPLFNLPSITEWQNLLLNQVSWFLISVFVLNILFSILYATAGLLKKIKIFGWLDRLAGLALSFGEAYLLIGLVGLFLQMPFITNGMQYVNSIPYMDVPIHTVDNLIEVFSKGEISFETLKDAILE